MSPLEQVRVIAGRRYLSLFLGVALNLWIFAVVANYVIDGDQPRFDRWLLQALRSPGDLTDPIGPVWFEIAVRDITALGGSAVLLLVVLATVFWLSLERRPRMVGLLLFAVVGGLLLSLLLKDLFDRPRPDFLPHGQLTYTASFPSGHSMNAAVVYLTVAAILACSIRQRVNQVFIMLLAMLVTVLVGISRVYLGVHWPTDVLAGWSAGAAWALLCWLLAHGLQRRHIVEAETGTDAPGAPPH